MFAQITLISYHTEAFAITEVGNTVYAGIFKNLLFEFFVIQPKLPTYRWINPCKIYVQSKKVNKCNPKLTCLLVIMHMHKKELLKIDDVQDKDS